MQCVGLVQADNTLATTLAQNSHPASVSEIDNTKTVSRTSSAVPIIASDDSESHYLTLDAKRARRVVLQAPPVITTAELKRIQNWLSVQFHVVDSTEENGTTGQSSPEDGSTTT